MSKTVLYFILKFILLVLAQAVIFNNLVLFGVAMAFVFIYVVVSMPVSWSTNLSMTLAFVLGLAVDVFSDTLGVNALSCTILAFVRKPVFHLYTPHEEDFAELTPCQRSMGSATYMKYLLTMSLIYCLCFFCVEAMSLFNVALVALRIVASTVFTFIVIYALDSLTTNNNEKKL